jgi:hypothetical protein
MAKHLRKGDRVSWNTSQGETEGTVVARLTAPMKIKGHKVKAGPADPEYLVEVASGARAAHRPEALKKR